MPSTKTHKTTKILLVTILILAIFIFGKLWFDKRKPVFIFNHSSFIVVSSSMEPNYPINSIVIIKLEDFSNLVVGDVIVYKSEALKGELAFHRITRVTEHGVYTKGDKNTFEDNQLITQDSYVGKGVSGITFLAKYLSALRTPQGFILFFILPIGAIILLQKSIKLLVS